jgi:F-type H+-transporting ATPase subunit b
MIERVVIAAAASEQAHPLIDIDFTVVIQFFLFLVLVLIASRTLFRPYLRMRDDRIAGMEGAREEASRLQAQGAAQLADYEEKLNGARARAESERRKMRAEAGAHEREVIDKTSAEASRTYEEARASIAKQAETARAELAPTAETLGRQLATKLLGREIA